MRILIMRGPLEPATRYKGAVACEATQCGKSEEVKRTSRVEWATSDDNFDVAVPHLELLGVARGYECRCEVATGGGKMYHSPDACPKMSNRTDQVER